MSQPSTQPDLSGYASLLSSLRDLEQGKTFSFRKSVNKARQQTSSSSSSSLSSLGGTAAANKLSSVHSTSAPGIDDDSPQNASLGPRLNSLTHFTSSAAATAAAAGNTESLEKEERTSLLVASITQTSKLLNKQPNLPPHLQIFKRDFEKFHERNIKLPTLHQLSPRTRKQLSLLPPPTQEITSRAEKLLAGVKSISGAKAYENLQTVVTASRVTAQQQHRSEEWARRFETEQAARHAGEKVLIPTVSLRDLGVSQEQLTVHDSTHFFDSLEEQRAADLIKKQVASRWEQGSDADSATTIVSESDADAYTIASSRVGGGLSLKGVVKAYPFETASQLAAKLQAPHSHAPGDAHANANSSVAASSEDNKSTAAAAGLYNSIVTLDEKGRPIYDNDGNLLPTALLSSYKPVLEEVSRLNQGIQSRYKQLQHAQRKHHAVEHHLQHREKSLLEEMKIKCYDDLGLDLDAQFTAARLASKAVSLMMFYMIEVKLKESFLRLKEQVRLASIGRRETAAAKINRVARGMLARAVARQIRRLVYQAREIERRTVETRNTAFRKAADVVTRFVRWRGKILTIRKRLRLRIAARTLQRRARGMAGREKVRRLRRRNAWLYASALTVQCAVRQRQARRLVTVLRKIRVVAGWEANAEVARLNLAQHLRRTGAASFIIHCYRAYRIRKKLAIIIFWHRVEITILLQKMVRGLFARKLYKKLWKRKYERERRVREAATAIQKIARGRRARKIYKKHLMVKVGELVKKRKAKSEYLRQIADTMTVNTAIRTVYGVLRTFVPFRYILLRSKALRIQKVFRGYRARRRVFIMKIQAAVVRMNRKFNGGHHGALQLQRLFRGYRYRRERLKLKRRTAALTIQCAFRCSQARWLSMQKRIHRDAMRTVGLNVLTLMRFRKAQRTKRELRRYHGVIKIVQRFVRGCMGRRRFRAILQERRSARETETVNDLRVNYVLAAVQLRLIMESLERPLGTKPTSLWKAAECPALGPVQLLFLAAVGKKARFENAALMTNKCDSQSFAKFCATIKGLLDVPQGGRPETELHDDLYHPPKFIEKEGRGQNQNKGGGKGGMQRRGGAGGGKGPRGGGGQKGRDQSTAPSSSSAKPQAKADTESQLHYARGRFALVDAYRKSEIALAKGVKVLGKLDIEMFFTKSLSKGAKEITFSEFLELLATMARMHYGAPDEDEASVTSDAAQKAYEARLRGGANPPAFPASRRGSDANSDLDTQIDDDDNDDQVSVSDSEASSATEQAHRERMKEKRRNADMRKRAKRVQKERSQARVGDGRLAWPLDEITSPSKPNYLVLFIIKIMDSWRSQPWYLDMAQWMDQEARARLGVYIKRIQNLHFRTKWSAFRRAIYDNMEAREELKFQNMTVVIIQAWVRRFIGLARARHVAQVFLTKFIPDVGEPYWSNPSTRVTSLTKPLILGPYECLSVALPPPGLEFVITCSNCTKKAALNCVDCEDSYCRGCYDDLHCRGRRRFHHYFPIPTCGYCKFQHSSKCCLTCMTAKPIPGSPQSRMKESDRGQLCDCCFEHLHDEDAEWEEEWRADEKMQKRQIFARSREAYLVTHQLSDGVKTAHHFDFTVQECEECGMRASSWRCTDCKQIYCNTCLVALHSMGGPFGAHRAEKLPYYTHEMHMSFLEDQRTQIFQHKMTIVQREWKQRLDTLQYNSVIKLQAWWRGIFYGRRGRLVILKGRKKIRRAWRLRQLEEGKRNSLQYKLESLLGMAPALLSDTREEQVLREITIFGRQFAREYVWRNKDSFGFYKAQKGAARTGFDVGEIEELKEQARRGGYRMPGRVMLKKGVNKHPTSHDLRELLKPGMLVRCEGSFFCVRHVAEKFIRFDRIWRWDSIQHPGALLYRLPAFADEPRRLQYRALYYASNYVISNPISQTYLSAHASFFERLRSGAEFIENALKGLGFKKGSVAWRKYAAKMERRATWAQNLIDERVDEVDLSKQQSGGVRKPGAEGGGGAVAAALAAAVAAGEIEAPEEEDEEDEGAPKKQVRAYGEPWEANEDEIKARLQLEASMSEDELIATAAQWAEEIDPMTENIFWVNKITFEKVNDKPQALRRKITKEERMANDARNAAEAKAKMELLKGKKGGKAMKKK